MGRSAAEEARSVLTRREQRLLLCFTYPHDSRKTHLWVSTPTITFCALDSMLTLLVTGSFSGCGPSESVTVTSTAAGARSPVGESVTEGFEPGIADVRDDNSKPVAGFQGVLCVVAEPGGQSGDETIAALLGLLLPHQVDCFRRDAEPYLLVPWIKFGAEPEGHVVQCLVRDAEA